MTIHVTPIPSTLELAAPSFTLGTSNAAGDTLTPVASNSTLLVFDTTEPASAEYGASVAVGSATVVSRRDHAHSNPINNVDVMVEGMLYG